MHTTVPVNIKSVPSLEVFKNRSMINVSEHLVTLFDVIFSNMTGILSHFSYIFY